ncbi:MAG: hypothetical protein KKE76_02710 [Gammaproteobacteria bacterium]|nr:hypothetical protein [Gammaproteobacteria bacterium]
MLLSGFLAATALPRLRGLKATTLTAQRTDSRALMRTLAGLFPRPANARAVGISYLRQYPERSDRHQLLTDLGLDTAGAGMHDAPSLLNHLRDGQQRDFITGDTVTVNRWILSRTEASICALLALA